jgi:hypothetical protein
MVEMIRRALVAGCLVATLPMGCGTTEAGDGGTEPAATELTIEVRAEEGAVPSRYELACDPPRGNLPDPDAACEALARDGARAFAPTPGDVACTLIYGGPQLAHVRGTVGGLPVDATFSRQNGCEIDRWDRLRDVVPLPPASTG